MDLNFLKDVKLEPVKKSVATRASVIKLPEDADIRVFANGKVFPSKAFAELAKLEFVPKAVVIEGSDPEVIGNGLDIFSSEQWGMVDLGENKVLFCYLVPKSYAKVDMWANTKYDAATGEPKASVFTQGASTFSKAQLLGMIADVYGTDWENTEYVDMVLVVENIMPSASNMYDIPKIISGGEKKGQWTNVRRQNINVCPIVVKHTQMKGVPAGSSTETPPALDGPPQQAAAEIVIPPEAANLESSVPPEAANAIPVAELDVKDPIVFDPQTAGGDIKEEANPEIPESAIPPNPLFTEPVTKVPSVTPAADAGTNWAKGLGATIPKGAGAK